MGRKFGPPARRAAMQYLIPLGSVVTVAGLALLMFCVAKISRAKKAKLSDDEMRAVLQSVVPMNLGALLLSGIGLMMVVLGIILG
jgi:hypothetical protein